MAFKIWLEGRLIAEDEGLDHNSGGIGLPDSMTLAEATELTDKLGEYLKRLCAERGIVNTSKEGDDEACTVDLVLEFVPDDEDPRQTHQTEHTITLVDSRTADDHGEVIDKIQADAEMFVSRAVHSEVNKPRDELLAAFEAAVERMEHVAESIPVQNRAKGVSQRTHVQHMAGHLAQHAKIARAAIEKARRSMDGQG